MIPVSGATWRSLRPYWHVDAKWVAGLLLLCVLGTGLLLASLWWVTAERPAVDTVSTFLALSFSPKGLDDETEIAQLRQTLRASPTGVVQPVEGLRVTVREEDIVGRSPREVRLYLFGQLAGPFYREGLDGLTAMADDPEVQRRIEQGVGPLVLFTAAAHRTLQRALILVGICTGVLLVPLIAFSYRFGRVGSPGVVLFAASLPGTVLSSLVRLWLRRAVVAVPPTEEAGLAEVARYFATNALLPLVQPISRIYLLALVGGLGLALLALVGSIIAGLGRGRPAPPAGPWPGAGVR